MVGTHAKAPIDVTLAEAEGPAVTVPLGVAEMD